MKENIFPKPLLLSILFLIVGCVPESTPEITNVPLATSTALAILNATPISTPVIITAPTPVEVTAVNTMTSDEQKNFVRTFLLDSGDCRLPCWWEITPGDTWGEAEQKMYEFGASFGPVFSGQDSGSTVYATSITVTRSILGAERDNVFLEEKDGLAYAWHLISDGNRVKSNEFRRSWRNYSAQKILKAYGMPDEILLKGVNTHGFYYDRLYSLWVFYDKLGFSLLYEALVQEYFSDASFFRICSEYDPLLTIEINTQSPDNPLPLERFDRTFEQIRLGTDIGKGFVIRSLNEVTGLSDEEIYETYIQEKNPCFTIPADIWWVK